MKDRLKSAFNRNSPNTTPENSRADDAPDYSAIFNGNRSAATQKNPRFNGPPAGGSADETQLAQAPSSATMRNSARQIAQDIEEAEIVVEPSDEPAANPEWEAASLKTRKAEAPADTRRAPTTAEVANDVPDYSAIFKNHKSRTAEGKSARPPVDASAADRSSAQGRMVKAQVEPRTFEQTGSVVRAEALKPVFKEEVRPASGEDSKPAPEAEAKYDNSNHEEAVAQKSKSRFFGDFASTESVRLKVAKGK